MYRFTIIAVVATLLGACATKETSGGYAMSGLSGSRYAVKAPPMDPNRKIDEQDCSQPIQPERGNLLCK